MKLTSVYLLILGIFITAFGCEQKEDELQSSAEDLIVGEWQWVESAYLDTPSGIPYILNPDSVGYDIIQVYFEDGTYNSYISDHIESAGLYWFDRIVYNKESISEIRLFTQKDDFQTSVNYYLSNDTLILDNSEVDGARRTFVKITEKN
ncbi:MAG: hypothetical protein JXJ22_16565 [Bacteroidales bacterium]|nr:hypothetical protein [Bacteroidales bacterium]